MFGIKYDLWTGEDSEGSTDNQTKHYTFLFSTFMYMNLFNEILCRKVEDTDKNKLSNILSNPYYLILVPLEFFVVYVMTHKFP